MKMKLFSLTFLLSLISLFLPLTARASTLSGNYDTLTISASGSALNPNVYVGDGTAVIKCLVISGDYISVSNVIVTECPSHAVLITGKNDIFENSKVYHNVTENGSGICLGVSSWGSAVKAENGSENTIIRGNEVYENCGEGIGITMSKNVLIENNIVKDNYSVNIYLDNSPFATANNNTVSCTGTYLRDGKRMSGIVIAEEDYGYWDPDWGQQRHDVTITGNSIGGCDVGIASWNSMTAGSIFVNGTISGNLITNGQSGSIWIDSFSNMSSNQNVLISNNTMYTNLYLTNLNGITLLNNTIGISISYNIADLEPDGDVDIFDFNRLVSDFGKTGIVGWIRSDIISDGRIDIFDFNKLIVNYGK